MVDERMTEVRVTRIARDGAEITLERTVPTAPLVEIEWHGREMLDIAAEIAETGDDERRVPEAEIAWRRARDGSHPDVADSAARLRERTVTVLNMTTGRRREVSGDIVSLGPDEEVVHIDWPDIGRRATQRLHAEVGCKCPSKAWSCEPHSSSLTPGICVTHSHAGIESEAPTGPAILKAWQRGWRPGDEPDEQVAPVEPDELAQDRAEQLIAALAVALRGQNIDPGPGGNLDFLARVLLDHPWVRKALEPAKAVVWAEPLGTIVSWGYGSTGARYVGAPVPGGRPAYVTVRLDLGVTVSADTIGKKVAVAQ